MRLFGKKSCPSSCTPAFQGFGNGMQVTKPAAHHPNGNKQEISFDSDNRLFVAAIFPLHRFNGRSTNMFGYLPTSRESTQKCLDPFLAASGSMRVLHFRLHSHQQLACETTSHLLMACQSNTRVLGARNTFCFFFWASAKILTDGRRCKSFKKANDAVSNVVLR